MSSPAQEDESEKRDAIRITIPERYYLLPGAAMIVGVTIGLFRGSRRESLRFLAENVHRPPTTVKGWYFYQKTKNYRVMWAGLKEAGTDAAKLGTTAMGWVAIEEGCKRAGVDDVAEIAAGLGTAGVFSLAYRLPWKATSRTLVLGLLMGTVVRTLRWGQDRLREQAKVRAARIQAATAEARVEAAQDLESAVETLTSPESTK